jgi:hypothetical protein
VVIGNYLAKKAERGERVNQNRGIVKYGRM